jgi:sec-independent protein translocase protein TatC
LPTNIELVAFSPADVFMAIIQMAVVFSVLLSLPIILVEVLRFVSPALFEKEKRFIFRFLPVSLILFAIGMIFGVAAMAFLGMNYLADFGASYGVKNYWSFGGVMETFYLAGVGFGLAFQFPLMMYFLNKFNVLAAEKMGKFRGHVVVGLLFVSALLTPSPDALSQVIMFVPIYALFEGTLLYLKISNKRRRNRDDRHN